MINLIVTWSKTYITSTPANAASFAITDTNLYVPVITISVQDNAKLLKSGCPIKIRILVEQLTGININQKQQ